MQREHLETTHAEPIVHDTGATVHVAGHELLLFAESPPLIDAMLADIRAARSRVWMETYIYVDDEVGRRVTEALCERAEAGLDVRLMIDGFGSFSLASAVVARLEAAGVQVHVFHAIGRAFKSLRYLQQLNQRNHRKLLIVDDRIAYFGGMNIVDQKDLHTAKDAKALDLPVSAGWRDVHTRMKGPRQAEIVALMERLWRRVHHEPRDKPPRWVVPDFRRIHNDAIYLFDSRPSFKDRRPSRVLIPLIRQAQESITIAMAYFVPMGRVLRELARARRRGVRVRIILPGQNDVKVVQWAARHFYDRLLKRGIEIYERHDRMMHGKAMVIDDRWSVIGSCNLDARSLQINLEFLATIHSRALAAELNRICDEEIAHSIRIDEESVARHTWWERQRDWISWSFRKWL